MREEFKDLKKKQKKGWMEIIRTKHILFSKYEIILERLSSRPDKSDESGTVVVTSAVHIMYSFVLTFFFGIFPSDLRMLK